MRFFTSDQHFGHKNIIEYSKRPFESVAQMELAILTRFNDAVSENDDVYHLGDVSLDEHLVAGLMAKMRGRHHLVAGNHDACHPCHRRHARAERLYRDAGFATVQTALTFDIEGFGRVDLCHFPYRGDHTSQERYTELRPVDEGHFLIHGHVHEAWRTRGRMLNVGVDVHDFRPLSEPQVAGLLREMAVHVGKGAGKRHTRGSGMLGGS